MLDLTELQAIQRQLQEKYKHKWEPIDSAHARNKLLWLTGEVGEVAQVIKHHGDDAIVRDPATRNHFIEEMCDVMMYWNDILLCYGITPEEVEAVYRQKHERNMNRW